MRFVAYFDENDTPMMGVVIDGAIMPLCGVTDFYADIDRYRTKATTASGRKESVGDVRPAVPVPDTARVICAGLNYHGHAAESQSEVPTQPDVFGRWASTLTPGGTPIPLPPREETFDWEGELAAVIGRTMRDVSIDEAESGIFGYTCFNDLSARTFQFAGRQMTIGKNADLSGPIGSQIVEPDDVGRARDLQIITRVNGEVKQRGSTKQLIFTAAEIISYVSGCMSLRPGDVVATGTPAGVGYSRTPPERLSAGDTVTVSIEEIGSIENQMTSHVDLRLVGSHGN